MPPQADKLMMENMSKNLIGAFPSDHLNSDTNWRTRLRWISRNSCVTICYHVTLRFAHVLRISLEALHTRCEAPSLWAVWCHWLFFKGISILADMWHAPSAKQAIGTATTGSSEAIQLGGLAMKKIWQEKRKAAGKSIHEPGLVAIIGIRTFAHSVLIDQISSWGRTLK